MRLIASFRGKNREFRAWLAAGMPENVISLATYKKKKAAKKAAVRKALNPSIV